MTLKRAAASVTVAAIGPAVSCVYEIGTMPSRLTSPTVGLRPTTPVNAAGEVMEPFVSVPIAISTRPAETADAEPELDPHGERSRACGLSVCPPTALQPLTELGDRILAHSLRLALPMTTPPARSILSTKVALRVGTIPANASEPAVVAVPSATAILS